MPKVLAPPPKRIEPDELEALIREARARQRRRWIVVAALVATAAAAALSMGAAGRGGGSAGGSGGNARAATASPFGAGRRQILKMGSSGGVTWAIDGIGMWLTVNGGRTWRTGAPSRVRKLGRVDQRIQQVKFFDRRVGWLTAADSWTGAGRFELDWTHDGGRTWHRTMPKGCCGAFSFPTARRGYFVGQTRLFSTGDGGVSWQPGARTPFAWGVPTFVDARRGVAVAGKGRLFSTSDGGKRWTSVHVPRRQAVLPNVAVFGDRLVVPAELVGPPASRLIVYVSDDAGATWKARPAPKWWVPVIGSSDPSEFSAASPSVWYAVGWHQLAVTTDAGRSWRLVKVVGWHKRWTISTIDFTSPRVGWAIFQLASPPGKSVLMRTTDGGAHWTPAGPRKPKHSRQ